MTAAEELAKDDSIKSETIQKKGIIFYNYPSVPLPLQALENLVKFVTSQLSMTIIHFFLCCDVFMTAPDVLEQIEKLPSCEVVHIGQRMDIGEQISRRALRQTGEKKIALVTDQANYKLLFENRPSSGEIVIFYPPTADESFYAQADRAIQLPIKMDEGDDAVKVDFPIRKGLDINKKMSDFVNKAASKIEELKAAQEELNKTVEKLLEQWTTEQFESDENDEKSEIEEEKETEGKWAETEDGWNKSEMPVANVRMMRPGGDFESKSSFESRNPFESQPNPFERTPMMARNQSHRFAGRNGFDEMKNPFEVGGPSTPHQTQKYAGHERFKKPAAQCPHWQDSNHRTTGECHLWHPHKPCIFFPMCRVMADNCGYSHPFCTSEGECQCEGVRDPQLNHYITEEEDM